MISPAKMTLFGKVRLQASMIAHQKLCWPWRRRLLHFHLARNALPIHYAWLIPLLYAFPHCFGNDADVGVQLMKHTDDHKIILR